MKCDHMNFNATVNVARITKGEGGPVERFQADVRIECADCGIPMRFVGLPSGLDLTGAAVSVDGQEARLTCHPRGEVMTPLDGAPTGFTVRRVQ